MAAKIKAAVKNKDINSMFNEICGDGVVAPKISFEKYTKLKNTLNSLLTLLENFSKGQFVKQHKEYEKQMAEILVFCMHARKEISECMPEPPFTEIQTIIPGHIPLADIESFSNTYKKSKTMKVVNTCIQTCHSLVSYRKDIEEKKNNYIKSMPGATFTPFPFTSFNVKEAFIRSDIDEKMKLNIMTFIALVFEYTHSIYKIYTSPDWDPEAFTYVMRENLVEIRKRIPRCDKAFDRIDNSLDLLKEKMDSYYTDYISTKNPSVMMENFVNDVANENSNTSPEVARQFRTIIKRYKEMTAGGIKDPRMKSLYDQVNNIGAEAFKSAGPEDDE